MAEQQFDVFMCHNGEDKPAVIRIARQLQDQGIEPWLDEWELRPGLDWQNALEAQIEQIKTAAVFVGNEGLGPW
ncbi:MAG: toll/interleukin-1 receptor domain-containing protein [Cyanobacteria bacterium J06597_16]